MPSQQVLEAKISEVEQIEELLKQRYANITTKRLTGAFEIRDEEVDDFISNILYFLQK